ncbi:ATPase [Christiangramia sp.]|uniref:ATPase n=1 Tax=Christiangramia sp. TaxID=1931228 RepID=UPI002620B10E|nr:ATPase [Christiangramia sp.]
MINPSKIKEGGMEYSLGNYNGEEMIYDFKKILIYLEAKGKLLFGQQFRIYPEDHGLIHRLCNYFIRDPKNCGKYKLNPDKGLLLSGPVGCGKTSLMKLLRYLVPHQRSYEVIPCRNIVFGFNHIGYKIIEDYGSNSFLCFDDMGVEPLGKYYGKDCNVIGEIMLSRYELFLEHKVKTHVTTNLNAEELEEKYGSRVRSRMRQLFNLVAFEPDSIDKRK